MNGLKFIWFQWVNISIRLSICSSTIIGSTSRVQRYKIYSKPNRAVAKNLMYVIANATIANADWNMQNNAMYAESKSNGE